MEESVQDVQATTSWKNGVQRVPMKLPRGRKVTVKELPFLPEPGKITRTTNQLQHISMFVLKALEKSQYSDYVRMPVDPVREGALNYYDVITNPMDLRTIGKRLQHEYYWSAKECMDDFRLVFDNCYRYNLPHTEPYLYAKKLEELYNERMAIMPKDEDDIARGSRIRKSVSHFTPDDVFSPAKRFKTIGECSPSLSEASHSTTGSNKSRSGRAMGMVKKRRPRNPLVQCREMVDELFTPKHSEYAHIFHEPVDPIQLGIPHYFDVISDPMDLSTIREKFKKKEYTEPSEFRDDMILMLDNCFKFNHGNDEIINLCSKVKQFFCQKYKRIVQSDDENDWESALTGHNRSEASIIEPYGFSKGSTDDTTNLERDYLHLSKDQKRKVVQMVKDYGDGSCISLRHGKEEINFQSLSTPTLRALKATIAVLNETLRERCNVTTEQDVLKSKQHLDDLKSPYHVKAQKDRTKKDTKQRSRRLSSSSSSSYTCSSENESDHYFEAGEEQSNNIDDMNGISDDNDNHFSSDNSTTSKHSKKSTTNKNYSQQTAFLRTKEPCLGVSQLGQIKTGTLKTATNGKPVLVSPPLPSSSKLKPKHDRKQMQPSVSTKSKMEYQNVPVQSSKHHSDLDSTVKRLKERIIQREQTKLQQRQTKLVEETAIQKRVNANLAQRHSSVSIPTPRMKTEAVKTPDNCISPSGSFNNSGLSIVSRITAQTSAPVPSEHRKREEERKRKIEDMKKEAQLKRQKEARSGPMYEFWTARKNVHDFEVEMGLFDF